MFTADQSWDAKGYWAPYSPSDRAPWDLRRGRHLTRPGGFAGTLEEVQGGVKEGPVKSIPRLLKGETRREGAPADFRDFADTLARLALEYRSLADPRHLKAWWVYRM